MSKTLKITILILAIASLIISISWTIDEGGYEPIALVISSLSGLIVLVFSNDFLSLKAAKSTIEGNLDNAVLRRLPDLANLVSLDLENKNYIFKKRNIEKLPLFVKIVKQQSLASELMPLDDVFLRHNPNTIFVTGKAGTGKSFYLKSICKEILEANSTNKIPVFIDLKEWQASSNWSISSPPTVEDLYIFSRDYLLSKFPLFRDFIQKHFHELHYTGVLVYIFDSFDEIPGLANYQKGSYLMSKVFAVINDFQIGGRHSNGLLGVLACRRETLLLNEDFHKADLYLEIQEINESTTIEKLSLFSDLTSEEVATWAEDAKLGERFPKTPFDLSLLILFVSSKKSLPSKLTTIYQAYIEILIESNIERFNTFNISKAAIEQVCKKLATKIITKGEINTETIINQVKNKDIKKIIDFSISSNLLIINENSNISFEHRKITEYFYAMDLLDSNYSSTTAIYSQIINYHTLYIFLENSTDKIKYELFNHLSNTLRRNNFDMYNYNARSSLVTLAAVFQHGDEPLKSLKGTQFLIDVRNIIFSKQQVNIHKYRYCTKLIKLFSGNERDEMISQVLERMSVWYLEESVMLLRLLSKKSKKINNLLVTNLLKNIAFETSYKANEVLKYVLYHINAFSRLSNIKLFVYLNILERFFINNIFALILILLPLGIIVNFFLTKIIFIYLFFFCTFNFGGIVKKIFISPKLKDQIIFTPILTLLFFSKTVSKINKDSISSGTRESYDNREEMMNEMARPPKWSILASIFLTITIFIFAFFTGNYGAIFLLLILLLFSYFIFLFYMGYKDKSLPIRKLKESEIDRELIFNSLYSIAIPGNRREFISILEKMNLKKVEGEWPQTNFPPHDLGSSYLYKLSKLDEIWIELNSPDNVPPNMPA